MIVDLASFAARRRKAQDEMIAALEPVVTRALKRKQAGSETWFRAVVRAAKPLYDQIVSDDGGDPTQAHASWARLSLDLTHSLIKTSKVDQYTHTVIATWLSSAILSAATVEAANQAGEQFDLQWITMHDSKVRHTHREAQGQVVHPGHAFRVGTSRLRWPGDTSAPIGEWINCRCTVAPVPIHDIATAAVDTEPHPTRGVVMSDQPPPSMDAPVPWHGVLAPEGVWSGDKRKFAPGALTNRDLPLPLTYQKTSDEGHKGSVTVASIDYITRTPDGLMKAGGTFMSTPEADDVVGLLAHFGTYGVSVDADDAEFELDEDEEGIVFTAGRISSASVVAIPAFQEAFIALGTDPEITTDAEVAETEAAAATTIQTIDWASLTTTATTNTANITAGRGPGWLTNPVDTKRIHDYWTVPGEPGYEKIGWGVPGDFNRCRVEVGQEIAENSPEKTRFLNQICAQWHHDALGFWPGHAPTEQASDSDEEMAPAISLVASATTAVPPADWFTDPHFTAPTPITITDEGRISGHLAEWNVCHVAFEDQCVLAPHSATGYSDFLTGEVVTDGGRVPVGQITLGGKHAPSNLRMRAAASYYDTTSAAIGDVTCGEDEHGIWVAGWVRPWASEQQVYELRAASLSGDWRRHMGNMELIAAHAVNSPGLPVSRTKVGISRGEQVSLVAAAVAAEPDPDSPIGELAEAIAAALEDRADRRQAVKELAPIFEEA